MLLAEYAEFGRTLTGRENLLRWSVVDEKSDDAKLKPHGAEWLAAEAAGVDMSLVELSLAKTPEERVRDHDGALAFAQSPAKGAQPIPNAETG